MMNILLMLPLKSAEKYFFACTILLESDQIFCLLEKTRFTYSTFVLEENSRMISKNISTEVISSRLVSFFPGNMKDVIIYNLKFIQCAP